MIPAHTLVSDRNHIKCVEQIGTDMGSFVVPLLTSFNVFICCAPHIFPLQAYNGTQFHWHATKTITAPKVFEEIFNFLLLVGEMCAGIINTRNHLLINRLLSCTGCS